MRSPLFGLSAAFLAVGVANVVFLFAHDLLWVDFGLVGGPIAHRLRDSTMYFHRFWFGLALAFLAASAVARESVQARRRTQLLAAIAVLWLTIESMVLMARVL